MLNPQILKKEYLRKSPIWQHFIKSSKQLPIKYYAINTKLFAAYLIKSKNIERSYIQSIVKQHSFNIDYNIMRLYAYYGIYQQKISSKTTLSRYQLLYLENLNKFIVNYTDHQQNKQRYHQASLYMIQLLNCYEKQLSIGSCDELDELIIFYMPNTIVKIIKLTTIREFYWPHSDSKSIFSYIDQLLIEGWTDIDTLSPIIARINVSKIYLSNLYSNIDNLVHSRQSFKQRVSLERDMLKPMTNLQFEIYKKTLICYLRYLNAKETVFQYFKLQNYIFQQFFDIITKLKIEEEFTIIEKIAVLCIFKDVQNKITHKINIKLQAQNIRSIYKQTQNLSKITSITQKLDQVIRKQLYNNPSLTYKSFQYLSCCKIKITVNFVREYIAKIIQSQISQPLYSKDQQQIIILIKLCFMINDISNAAKILIKVKVNQQKLLLLNYDYAQLLRQALILANFKKWQQKNPILLQTYLMNPQYYNDRQTEVKKLNFNNIYDYQVFIKILQDKNKVEKILSKIQLFNLKTQNIINKIIMAPKSNNSLISYNIKDLYKWCDYLEKNTQSK